MDNVYTPTIKAVLGIWRPYVDSIEDWTVLVGDVEPKATGCGPIYELAGLLDRHNESFAIADMRGIKYAQPHYHTNGETEIYFVLQGQGCVVVGGVVMPLKKGDVTVISTETAHYAIPDKNEGLVLAVINTPPFNPKNNIDLMASNNAVGYSHEQFKELTDSL